MQKFEIKLNSSFAANFANAVQAQPKDHDPAEPKETRLIKLKNGVERYLGATVHVYICIELPIDRLHSTDLMLVCWSKRTFVTIDLTTFPEGDSRAQKKLIPSDLSRNRFGTFCEEVAAMLASGEASHAIRDDTLALIGDTQSIPIPATAGKSP